KAPARYRSICRLTIAVQSFVRCATLRSERSGSAKRPSYANTRRPNLDLRPELQLTTSHVAVEWCNFSGQVAPLSCGPEGEYDERFHHSVCCFVDRLAHGMDSVSRRQRVDSPAAGFCGNCPHHAFCSRDS